MPLDIQSGDDYISRVVDTPTFQPAMSKLSAEQVVMFKTALRNKVQAMLDAGNTIGQEALIIVAKK
jgi:hypothetical protein